MGYLQGMINGQAEHALNKDIDAATSGIQGSIGFNLLRSITLEDILDFIELEVKEIQKTKNADTAPTFDPSKYSLYRFLKSGFTASVIFERNKEDYQLVFSQRFFAAVNNSTVQTLTSKP